MISIDNPLPTWKYILPALHLNLFPFDKIFKASRCVYMCVCVCIKCYLNIIFILIDSLQAKYSKKSICLKFSDKLNYHMLIATSLLISLWINQRCTRLLRFLINLIIHVRIAVNCSLGLFACSAAFLQRRASYYHTKFSLSLFSLYKYQIIYVNLLKFPINNFFYFIIYYMTVLQKY